MIREVCSCGAEFETDEDGAVRLLREWRRRHRHEMTRADVDLSPVSGASVVETAPDHTIPELHIGFRALPDDDE